MADERTEEILEATHRALCAHGYADLTLRDVASETDRSKSSIHYHYGTKEELFAAFLDYLYDRYTARIDRVSGGSPRERLHALLDAAFRDGDSSPAREFGTALFEVKAQAPYDEALSERLAEFDRFLFERLRTIVADGVEAGEFAADVDPAVTAEFLVAAIEGGHARRVAVGRPPERLHAGTCRYVETYLRSETTVDA